MDLDFVVSYPKKVAGCEKHIDEAKSEMGFTLSSVIFRFADLVG